MSKYRFPFSHVHLEISSKCYLKCPRCPRTEHPETPWIGKELSLFKIKKMIPEKLLLNYLDRITLCGDVGDPIYNNEFHQIITYFKKIKPQIHLYIITNGSYRSTEWWSQTAAILNQYDTVSFSIDGPDDETNQQYRKNSDWESIESAMLEMNQSKAYMVWAAIGFKFNQHLVAEMKELAQRRGCDYFQLTKSTKFGSKYARFKNNEGIDELEPSSDLVSATNRFERTVQKLSERPDIENSSFLQEMKNRTDAVAKLYNSQKLLPLCLTGNRGVYMNVTGQIFPCSWVSFPYNRLLSADRTRKIEFSESFFHVNSKTLNILHSGLEEVMNNQIWDKFFERLEGKKDCFIECEQKCQKSQMDEKYLIGWNLN